MSGSIDTCNDQQQVIHTTCAYCGVGCGIKATITDKDLHMVDIEGRKDHPANFGRLCSKGSALGETVSLENRLLTPFIGEQRVSWDSALDEVAERLKATIEEYGPEAVALYGSGQLLTEDYYVANKLMKGFIGSSNMDTNSRLCMASTVAGQKRSLGSDTVPGSYEDLELADMIVLVGANTAWCHPVLFQRIRAAKEQRPDMKVVVIDPRATDTCDIADLHLPLKSGTDTALFNKLFSYLDKHNKLDQSYIDQHTQGFNEALKAARKIGNFSEVAEICGIEKGALKQFCEWYAETDKVVTAWSQGVNQSVAGTDKVNAIINCHLITGRIGKPGSGPLSLTGQPNAMGGREVGGLANQLAAHMDFSNTDDVDRVRRFWKAPNIATAPGKTAVDLFNAMDKGDIKFVWIMGTNPVVSMPDANKVISALKKCPTVVVSDCIEKTDTSEFAHIRLPAAGWSEKDGTVTNSERRISRQRALFDLSGASKPDWWIISKVAEKMGFGEAFDYQRAADIFREHATLSAFENNSEGRRRDFDIGALAAISDAEYEALEPFQWPLVSGQTSAHSHTRLFAEGGFFTETGRATIVSTTFKVSYHQPNADYPLLLNTGRVRDHWHTMTRTALSPRLSQHIDEPFLEVHPGDAQKYGLVDQALCRLSTAFDSILIRVAVTPSVGKGNVFMPMHWTRQNSKTGHCGVLVKPAVDPWSKQPGCKHTPARIEAVSLKQQAVLLSRKKQDFEPFDYATEVKFQQGFRYELAGRGIGSTMLESIGSDKERIDYTDPKTGSARSVWFALGQLQALLIVGESLSDCDRAWLQAAFEKEDIPFSERWRLLAGMPPQGEDTGKVVCACFGVGEKTICRAIEEGGFSDPAQVGQSLKAGTNCGSCIPEIRKLITSATALT
ncbi:molybdopterin-dependent oxidoreductase [Endozoicomonas sp. 8E]|uniref:molybdopterin-dependent oxidoreductase n=1 Tax=Endozoicomonas sp. 8E TaxID=3035692 RepID=UPI002939436E|nr:molybdopterin-dependent oxidoreductase [Endozoicomonas sp. 8E]WOG29833.1 molybdopterin-dependent oxidoreductase [Endozoicomonas sp. 8E]